MYAYFRCLHAPHDKGTRFRLRTTLNCGSGGDCPALEEVVEGGVGGMVAAVSSTGMIWDSGECGLKRYVRSRDMMKSHALLAA
jgi:hypothetical protein